MGLRLGGLVGPGSLAVVVGCFRSPLVSSPAPWLPCREALTAICPVAAPCCAIIASWPAVMPRLGLPPTPSVVPPPPGPAAPALPLARGSSVSGTVAQRGSALFPPFPGDQEVLFGTVPAAVDLQPQLAAGWLWALRPHPLSGLRPLLPLHALLPAHSPALQDSRGGQAASL